MHEGVDFGAPVGSPVYAAGDGMVEEARWAGGYGRWVKIRHTQALETAYAHLSAWAAGIHPGARVRQGQVIGYVGATGLATGPHLHYEVIEAGRPVDPRTAALAKAEVPSNAAKAAFRARKAMIDAMIAPLKAG
jgi:murein DD-endopeptidase MepM/ murein hydrolase activator NlpD